MPNLSRLGIDIGHVRTKAAQCDRRGNLTHLTSFPRQHPGGPVDEHEAFEIAETLARQGFTDTPVVLASDCTQERIEELSIPPIEDANATSRIVASELARVTHWAPGTFQFASWSIPNAPMQSGANAMLAVASTHEHCEAVVEPFAAVGFDIEAIDVRPSALARTFRSTDSNDAMVCVVDIGWQSTRLSVSQGHDVLFVRELPATGLGQIAESLGVEAQHAAPVLERLAAMPSGQHLGSASLTRDFQRCLEDRGSVLAEELNRTFAYIAHRFPSAETMTTALCGGGARFSLIAQKLRESVGRDIVIQSPMQIACGKGTTSRFAGDPSLVCAAGLALWHGDQS